jgi:hypothetical protein
MDTKMEAVQESIKLALDAADAATDVTSEYNKVKKAHALLEAKVKQIHKYTTVVFLSSIISGLVVIVVSAFLFMQSSDKLTNMTETSREALVVFAENVDGVNASLKNLDTAIKKQGDLGIFSSNVKNYIDSLKGLESLEIPSGVIEKLISDPEYSNLEFTLPNENSLAPEEPQASFDDLLGDNDSNELNSVPVAEEEPVEIF